MDMATVNTWISALLTLAIFSFLYKDNPFYKFAEHLFVGVSAGYGFVRVYLDVVQPKLFTPLGEQLSKGPDPVAVLLLLLPLALSIMMLLRLVPSLAWTSRYPLAFIIGTSAGINFINYLRSDAIKQVESTILPLYANAPTAAADFTWLHAVSNLLIIVGVITGLLYFFFSKEHTGAFGAAAKVGIYFLMVSFGASFGYTVMARVSLLIGRFQFLLGDWLGLL